MTVAVVRTGHRTLVRCPACNRRMPLTASGRVWLHSMGPVSLAADGTFAGLILRSRQRGRVAPGIRCDGSCQILDQAAGFKAAKATQGPPRPEGGGP
jgi:hypothetical protein